MATRKTEAPDPKMITPFLEASTKDNPATVSKLRTFTDNKVGIMGIVSMLVDLEEAGKITTAGRGESMVGWWGQEESSAPVVEAKPKRKRRTKAEMQEAREKEAQRLAYAAMRDEELDRQTFGGKPYSKQEEEEAITSYLPTARQLLALPSDDIVILTPNGPVEGTEENVKAAIASIAEVTYDDLADDVEPESQTGLTRAQVAAELPTLRLESPETPAQEAERKSHIAQREAKPFKVTEHESDLEKRGELLDAPEFIPAKPDGVSDNAWFMAHAANTEYARKWWMEYAKRQAMAFAISE